AHVALGWVRAHEGVSSVLVGARNADEVALNLPAFDLALPDEIIKELDELTEGIKSNLGNSPDMWHGENRMR
ncbi:MAG: aldo/keto reductase, partial [SAR202 cluster bacterium]|nr:aldo/keto reductase [SAR202 cluster bacterium]